MATDTLSQSSDEQTEGDPPSDELPQLVDVDRWSGTVIGTASGSIEWGTHTYAVRVQQFSNGRGNLQIGAPSDPPAAADAMLSDWLDGDYVEQAAAQILAREWDIEIKEVRR